MSSAEVCPLCKGEGKISPFNDGKLTAPPMPNPCRACSGRGIAWRPINAYRPTDNPGFFPGVPVDPGAFVDRPFGPSTTAPPVAMWSRQ